MTMSDDVISGADLSGVPFEDLVAERETKVLKKETGLYYP